MKSSKIDKIAKVDKNLELPCIKKVKNALNLEVIDNGYIIEIMLLLVARDNAFHK